MHDYEPIDLGKICNSSSDVLGTNIKLGEGKTTLHGIPFLFGGISDRKKVLVAGGAQKRTTIPVNKDARRVIVAHSLLKSPEDSPTGTQVAEYLFHYSGGGVENVPIREQFEINNPQASTARSTFNAVMREQPTLHPRYEGEFNEMGRRQMDHYSGPEFTFALWTWTNPLPSKKIESLEIRTTDASVVIAAVTIGHLDEHPFARQGRRPVRIELNNTELASSPFNVEASVDRGSTTYTYALPEQTSTDFVESAYKGWGEEQNSDSSPSYVEVSAVPSATLSVKQNGKLVANANWGDIQNIGTVNTSSARFQLMDDGKNWVHVTVLDDSTGKKVPCRIHFRSPDGVPYQPYGHHNHVNSNLDTFHNDIGGDLRLGQITYAYIDGACQGWLPRGEVIVDVARGFEYEPLRTTINIEPGQRELTLSLNRWTDMNAQGWYSGDSHVHFVGAQGAHREAQAEDLDVVNLLQSQWGSLFTNTEDFTGVPSISENNDSIVYVGQENRQHFYGHLILWGLKKPVMPWCTGEFGETEAGNTMESTLSDWSDQARAQGATVVAPHFGGLNGETAALVATGRISAVEMHRQSDNMHWEYYRTLNAGYRLPLLGGTDKMHSDVPVGMYRTYVKMQDGEEFSYQNWCKNVTKGRTFHSGGPIIHLNVDGHEIGDTVSISGPGTVNVTTWAESILPIYTLQLVLNGKVIASTESKKGARRLEISEEVKIDKHSWIAARCGGPDYFPEPRSRHGVSSKQASWLDTAAENKNIPGTHFDGWRRGVFAHTSPVYIACAGDWWMFDEATARHMLTVFEGDLTFMRNIVHQHEPGTVTHHHGQENHMDYLSKPFLEAQHAVIKRMKDRGITP